MENVGQQQHAAAGQAGRAYVEGSGRVSPNDTTAGEYIASCADVDNADNLASKGDAIIIQESESNQGSAEKRAEEEAIDTLLQEFSNSSKSFLQNLQDSTDSFPSRAATPSMLAMLQEEDLDGMLSAIPTISTDGEEGDQKERQKAREADEDDEMDAELGRLAAAEDNLRREMDLASFGFGLFAAGGDVSNPTAVPVASSSAATLPPQVLSFKSLIDDEVDEDVGLEEPANSASVTDRIDPNPEQMYASSSWTKVSPERVPEKPVQAEVASVRTPNEDEYVLIPPSEIRRQHRRALTHAEQARLVGLCRLPSDGGVFSCPLFRPFRFAQGGLESPLSPSFLSANASSSSVDNISRDPQNEVKDGQQRPEGSTTIAASTFSCHEIENRLREKNCREYPVTPLTGRMLRKLFVGFSLPHQTKSTDRKGNESAKETGRGKMDSSSLSGEGEISVRTVTIRIRPDVLCGAVMDAVTAVVSVGGGDITKRQGGHLRAILPSSRCPRGIIASPAKRDAKGSPSRIETHMSSPFIVDIQLCAKKRGKECERALLIRCFPIPPLQRHEVPPPVNEYNHDIDGCTDDIYDQSTAAVTLSEGNEAFCSDGNQLIDDVEYSSIKDASRVLLSAYLEKKSSGNSAAPENDENGTGEALAIDDGVGVQDEEGFVTGCDPGTSLAGTPTSQEVKEEAEAKKSGSYVRAIGNILTSPISSLAKRNTRNDGGSATKDGIWKEDFPACPSVQHGGKFPSLSQDDGPLVESAWPFLVECVKELETREIAYSSLSKTAFGAFPALPTLDAHYCSQLRLLIRENMIVSLLKTASELEQFAREAEHRCANLCQILKPTYDAYELLPPDLPQSVPLTAYPLDYNPPELSCPPWGQRVMEALNKVAAQSSGAGSSPSECLAASCGQKVTLSKAQDGFECSREAVSIVFSAFQRQDDEEQGARLGRKNVQVMDRLAKMQAHKRASIINIRDSYGSNHLCTKAADEFHSKSVLADATCAGSFGVSDQVPLLKCGILLGGSTGTCFVTANQILFVTQLIPLLGGSRYYLVSINEIELVVQPSSSKSLIQLPPGLSVRRKQRISKTSADPESSEVLHFIPSIDAYRFCDFVDIVRAVGTEDPDMLKFSPRGGLLYMFDDTHQSQIHT